MSLETDIQAAHEEQEAVETAAWELGARIRKIDGAAGLMPARAYGKPIDCDAIAKSLTLRSLIAQKDRHLAVYLGISIDTLKADAEIEAAKMRAERLRLETQRLCERNERAAKTREQQFIIGINPMNGRYF